MGLRKIKGWIHKPSPKNNRYGDGWVRELSEALVDEKLTVVTFPGWKSKE